MITHGYREGKYGLNGINIELNSKLKFSTSNEK